MFEFSYDNRTVYGKVSSLPKSAYSLQMVGNVTCSATVHSPFSLGFKNSTRAKDKSSDNFHSQITSLTGELRASSVVLMHPWLVLCVLGCITNHVLSDENVVTQNFDTVSSSLPDTNPPMPLCTYQVLSGGPNGEPVTFARVGDTVFHKWSCEYPVPDVYCMIIHSCSVDNGEDELVFEVIDQDGCAKDPVILGDLKYITDLMAGTEAQVFKFADKANVFFTCQVRFSYKNEHDSGICPKPKCGSAALRRFRFKRDDVYHQKENLSFESQRKENDFDLMAQPVTVLDIEQSHNSI